MLDDRLHELFEQIAQMPANAPPPERVVSRGQQRRRRARLQAYAVAGAIMVAAGVGAPQLPASLAVITGRVQYKAAVSAPQSTSSFSLNATSARAGGSSSAQQSGQPVVPPAASGESHGAAPLLPPAGNGRLLLGVDSAHRYVMTRVGSARTPIRVPGLNAVPGSPAVLATNPAGGWVVTAASTGSVHRSTPARLAVVAKTGRSVQFGPKFSQVTVTSAAVSLDGSRVAVAVASQSGPAIIEVLPLPGHRGSLRSWNLPATRAELVTGLSWAPGGRRLAYMAAHRTLTTSASVPGVLVLDTAPQSPATPAITPWAPVMKTGTTCVPEAVAWLGRSGRYAVLEACASSGTAMLEFTAAHAGSPGGPPLVVAHKLGCGPASLDSSASGDSVLISYCGLRVDDNGRLTKVPAGLTAAALSG
jgi:hypothetical protein